MGLGTGNEVFLVILFIHIPFFCVLSLLPHTLSRIPNPSSLIPRPLSLLPSPQSLLSNPSSPIPTPFHTNERIPAVNIDFGTTNRRFF